MAEVQCNLLLKFFLKIEILMSELNNVWRDVQRGPPDPFLVRDNLTLVGALI